MAAGRPAACAHRSAALIRGLSPALLCLFALLGAAEQSQNSQHQAPTIQVDVRLVNVFVTVTDREGAPVAGLTRDDFALSEDGHPQNIAVFERQTDLPLNIVLAVDTSGSVRKDFGLEEEAAHRFVHALLRPEDRLEVMEFSSDVREVAGFTNNLGRIDKALNSIHGGPATALYEGVLLGAQSLAPYSGRKVLVLISDGGNTVHGTSYDAALDEALRAEAMVYSIIDVPVMASAGRDLGGEHAMIALSRATGGRYFYTGESSLKNIFEQVSGDLRTEYLLGYYPRNSAPGDNFRIISVKLRNAAAQAGYTVRNRTGYYPDPVE